MQSAVSRHAFDALGSEHGIAILKYLRDREWTLASQVAKALHIHTTTAGKHLAAFHEAGFLERRSHKAKRPTYAYRLPSPVLRFEIDLADSDTSGSPPSRDVAVAFVRALLDGCERIGGEPMKRRLSKDLLGRGDWRKLVAQRMRRARSDAFPLLVEDARERCSGLVGASAGDRIVRMALREIASDFPAATAALAPQEVMA